MVQKSPPSSGRDLNARSIAKYSRSISAADGWSSVPGRMQCASSATEDLRISDSGEIINWCPSVIACLHQLISASARQCGDGRGRINRRSRNKYAAIDNVQGFDVVTAHPRIHHRRLRIVTHSAGTKSVPTILGDQASCTGFVGTGLLE